MEDEVTAIGAPAENPRNPKAKVAGGKAALGAAAGGVDLGSTKGSVKRGGARVATDINLGKDTVVVDGGRGRGKGGGKAKQTSKAKGNVKGRTASVSTLPPTNNCIINIYTVHRWKRRLNRLQFLAPRKMLIVQPGVQRNRRMGVRECFATCVGAP